MKFLNIVTVTIFLVVAKSENYTEDNATLIFNFYKEKYHKKYSERDEKEAYKNFVKNLNKVTLLNMNPEEKAVIYTLNKYADVDPSEIEEHFALNVTAYDVNEKYKGPILRDRNILRAVTEPTAERIDLETLDLYDLDDADNLFKRYLKAFKKNYTKKYDRIVHFYKFVKSLVSANRDNYIGNKSKELDGTADVIENPTDYYY